MYKQIYNYEEDYTIIRKIYDLNQTNEVQDLMNTLNRPPN